MGSLELVIKYILINIIIFSNPEFIKNRSADLIYQFLSIDLSLLILGFLCLTVNQIS